MRAVDVTLGELMSASVKTIAPEVTLGEAARIMSDSPVSCLVVRQHGRLLGILTERDMVAQLHNRAVSSAPVSRVMTSPVITARAGDSFRDGLLLMRQYGLHHLVVTNEEEEVLGVISESDMRSHLGLGIVGKMQNLLSAMDRQSPKFPPETPVIAALQRMVFERWDYVVVTQDEMPLGILTERDVPRLLRDQADVSALTLREVMSRSLTTIAVDSGLVEAVRMMTESGLRHLVVIDDEGRYLGVISQQGLLERIGLELIGDSLHELEALRAERKAAELELREREEIYSTLVNQAADAIVLIDGETLGFSEFNTVAHEGLGYTREEFAALTLADLQAQKSFEQVHRLVKQHLDKGGNNLLEVAHRRKDGSVRMTQVSSRSVNIRGKGYLLAIWHDITERKQAEEQIKLAASVFHDANEGILITDAEGTILKINLAFSAITGFQPDEVYGKTPRVLKSGRHEREFYGKLWQQLLQTEHWSGEIWNRRKNGEEYPEQLSISAVKDETGKTSHYVGIFTDITEHKQQQEQIEHLAYYDALTRLPNRVLLADRMQQALARADRKNKIVAVCYLDLDGFKPINDRYGHKAGDSVLMEISRRLQDFIRAEDTIARLGGDEFVLLLTDLSGEDESEPILMRMLEIVTKPCEIQGDIKVNVSASIGVTFYPTDHNDSDVLLRHADQAMYQAKQLGRNRMHHFDPRYDLQNRKLRELKTRVHAGLAYGDFILYWQPKIDLVYGRVVGAEALLRWKQADGSVLLPGAFLPQLENDDLIVEIGDYVIAQAVATLARWSELGLDLSASINVAARQMLAVDFMPKLHGALQGRADLAAHLEMEILETAALEDLEKVKRLINECRMLGIGTALDDFGTGYSSMTYFRRLPVDTVKIDQSFVRDMLDNADDLAIVQGILGLTKAFGKNSVAEGVELTEQLAVLQGMGCNVAQGYAIGYPMPEQEFLRWLEDYKPDMSWAQRR
ncbi:MAG: EAL domain-containing protein [Nitrosomonadales bacterium]|nr:EAL domain-containing protein [Nitrosomonadales bacterium]